MTKETVYTIVPETLDGEFIGNYNDDEIIRCARSYLHGELEGLVGFDLFKMVKSELQPSEIDEETVSDEFKEGIYPCTCMGKPCTFFRWKTGSSFFSYAGLVVLQTDKDAWDYAFKCYETKQECI